LVYSDNWSGEISPGSSDKIAAALLVQRLFPLLYFMLAYYISH